MSTVGAFLLCCSVGTLVIVAVLWRLRTQLADQRSRDFPLSLQGDLPRLPDDLKVPHSARVTEEGQHNHA